MPSRSGSFLREGGVSTGRRGLGVDGLFRTQYPQAADVGIFSIHVVREDDDLKNVGVYSFAGASSSVEWCCWRGGHSQSFSIITSFGGYVEGDPTIRLFECHDPDILEVGRTGSSPDAHGRWRV